MTIAESDPQTVIVRRDSAIDLPPGTVVDETYEVDARLGAGAMGEVYAARHTKLGKRVAIKVIRKRLSADATAIERFAREARALAQIQHPAIVAVEHVGELADGRAYFVMEYLRGESLHERLQRGQLALPEALRVLDQVARALEAAHAQGITHRDLKPENIYLVHLPGEAPLVKLVDFGLAKLAPELTAEDQQRSERTQSGAAIGTPLYMSPEQARGPDVDHRTDIYALGCVAYELLLGTLPFAHARTAPELYAAHLHEAPPLPRSIWPEVPPQLDLVLFAMLAKDPAHRPTLTQVRSVFVGARIASSQRAATELVLPRGSRMSAKALVTIIAAVVCALISGILIGTTLPSRASETAPSREMPATPASAQAPRAAVAEPIAPPLASPGMGSGGGAPSPARAHDADSSMPRPVASRPRAASAPPISRVMSTRTPHEQQTTPPVAALTGSAAPVAPIDRNQTVNPFGAKPAKGAP